MQDSIYVVTKIHFCLLKSVVGSQAGQTTLSVIEEGRRDLPRSSIKTKIAMADHGHGNLFSMKRQAMASSVAGNTVANASGVYEL